ncbi:MAG TPA: CDP-alcohol phosphatidyltransferase family protein [Candidatus Acidoferrum sp.]|nr:CDP-alcohol phosphatidyltransferase family protein [Candidatus Acidoferrum sp.]
MTGRRPLKTRGRAWAKTLARWLSLRAVAPNTISLLSLVPAAGAGACFLLLPHATRPVQAVLLLLAAGLIQLRLLANMLDGLVAVEGGRKTATGDLFNEVPDRVADVLILAPAGYALTWLGTLGITLGWLVALLAVLSAYVRVFGGSLGFQQSFIGPMAKQHRMALLTLTCLVSILEVITTGYQGRVLSVGLLIIGLGTALTIVRRLGLIARRLQERPLK